MRQIITLFFLVSLFGTSNAFGQEPDTMIYQTVQEPARFPGCEQLDTTISFIEQCANANLLNFVYSNIRYPQEAIQNNVEGSVVVRFVVEPDSTISSPEVLRDIGDGCGPEVIRVVNLINQAGAKWKPGINDGKPVRSYFTLPIKFKLEELPPYTMVGRDTVYTRVETPLDYEGGLEQLNVYLADRLDYPPSGNDSCMIGNIQVQVLIQPNGDVKVLDIVDFNDLGFDFWYESIDAATSTLGKWIPATFEGRKVPSAFDITMNFAPDDDACKMIVDQYKEATDKINEGAKLYNEGKQEEGIAKMSEAIEVFPEDANFLLARGQAYLDMSSFDEACSDISLARRISLIKWYDNVLNLICNKLTTTGGDEAQK
ncbi:MAG: energy transducer TonB [Saprospiraceae bacterium]|nr:energy transducer TonB [Saprospiraceae bacterium]